MKDHLFVYGSLMPGLAGAFGHAERTRLARESVAVGPAAIVGRLYDLGNYPGLMTPADADGLVHGTLVRILAPNITFAWLDPYEDIKADRPPQDNEYERVMRPVTAANGTIDSWVYLIRRVPAKALEIKTGRWHAPSL